ncbi:hypothetical protein HMPREF0072_0637 [Anaerococcus lactolyticus ATCC 51172]|uniref:Uncharacterized protein n=1 Tax=Anaerococcus lactolyticus ATCC 51172 TaxID=525254 RepID=C2BE67_9FIRM|nr:hypothetical protein HMPREF0072_0637 [Anaerococcus lactolyticus ATCC 51172]
MPGRDVKGHVRERGNGARTLLEHFSDVRKFNHYSSYLAWLPVAR